ncbi:MAG: PIN domain nuclease [Actinomycetota bacterium]|nr:PIN domain nuclease [Actinomycetota bacterium]
MSPAIYLIDTSGLFRILQGELRLLWAEELAAGVIAVCPVVELEFLYSARSLGDRLEKKRLLSTVFGWVPMGERAYQRAAAVQQLMTEVGQHRSAGPIDLLVAATAEQAHLTVLYEDRDFETVASVTRQRVRLVTDIEAPPDGPR